MRGKRLLTAPQVAKLCGADLKTIHNWVKGGSIRHFRTPGRHLRFAPEDVALFMTTFGYAVPAELLDAVSPLVLLIDAEGDSSTKTRRGLELGGFRVEHATCPATALITLGALCPAVAVVGAELPPFDNQDFIERLIRVSPCPVVVFTNRSGTTRNWDLAAAVVPKPKVAALCKAVESLSRN